MTQQDQPKEQRQDSQSSGLAFKILLTVIALGLLALVLKSIGIV